MRRACGVPVEETVARLIPAEFFQKPRGRGVERGVVPVGQSRLCGRLGLEFGQAECDRRLDLVRR